MGSILSSLTLVVFQLRQLCRHRMLQTRMFVGKGLPPNACLVDHAAMHAGRAREGTGGRGGGRKAKKERKKPRHNPTNHTTKTNVHRCWCGIRPTSLIQSMSSMTTSPRGCVNEVTGQRLGLVGVSCAVPWIQFDSLRCWLAPHSR